MRAPPAFRAYIPAALIALTPIALYWSSIPPRSRLALLIAALGILALLFVIIRSSRRTTPLINKHLAEADSIRRDRYLLLDSLPKRSAPPSHTSSTTPKPPSPTAHSSS
ncbi:MAG: hypothetical protein AB7G17_04950 [Phycisphaerales bacterium]